MSVTIKNVGYAEPAGAASASVPAEAEVPYIVIEPRPGWQIVDVAELWRYRELLFFLAWRDVKVRYKQTVLGAAWAVLQPLATMIVFTICLGRVARNPEAGVAYPLFLFAGLLPWNFFAHAVTAAGNSVIGNQNLITKVYFPRLIIPMSATGASAVDFAVAFVVLLVLMLCYGSVPGWGLLVVPLLAVSIMIAALGMGMLLSALTVAYRDFRHAVPFMVQLWMFATPAIYLQDESTLGSPLRVASLLNPVHGLIVNFRAAMLGTPYDLGALAASLAISAGLLLVGSLYFRRTERGFADIV